MKYFFLIAYLFCCPAFTQTECERAKQALEKTKAAHDKTRAVRNKNQKIYTKADRASISAHYAWERALRRAKANNDAASKAAWEKTDIALDKADRALKKIKVKIAWENVKAGNIKKHLEEAKKLKVEVIKSCKIDDTKTTSIFPYHSANPNEEDNLRPLPINALARPLQDKNKEKKSFQKTQRAKSAKPNKKDNIQAECKEAKQALEEANSAYAKTKPLLNYLRTYRFWKEALENWVKLNDVASKLTWEKADRAYVEARTVWKENKIGQWGNKNTTSKEHLQKHLKERVRKAHREVIKACKIDTPNKIHFNLIY